jgi:hypothetical protein
VVISGTRRGTTTTQEDPMTHTPTPLTRWLRRPHRHAWLADSRDTDYSAGRLIGPRAPRS